MRGIPPPQPMPSGFYTAHILPVSAQGTAHKSLNLAQASSHTPLARRTVQAPGLEPVQLTLPKPIVCSPAPEMVPDWEAQERDHQTTVRPGPKSAACSS